MTIAFVAMVGSALAAEDPAASRRPPAAWSLELTPSISIQKAAFDYHGGPYLNRGLGGTAPGLAMGVRRRFSGATSLTLELSTTTQYETMQGGRFVYGDACIPHSGPNPRADLCHDVIARGRDTLLSILLGSVHGPVELSGGVSGVLTHTARDTDGYGSTPGLAVTVGLTGTIPLSRRIAVAPTARYSHVFRSTDMVTDPGLGRTIIRVGVGLHVSLSRKSE